MARDPQNYSHNNQLSSTAESLIDAVPADTKDIVRKLSFYNSGSTVRTVTVYVVETSGTAGAANTAIKRAVSGGKAWNCIELQGEVFTEGMSLQADQDAGTDINVNCSGTRVQT